MTWNKQMHEYKERDGTAEDLALSLVRVHRTLKKGKGSQGRATSITRAAFRRFLKAHGEFDPELSVNEQANRVEDLLTVER